MRMYRCRACGSTQVYHHCPGTRARTIGVPIAKAPVLISKPTTVVFSTAANVEEEKKEYMEPVELCDVCDRPRDRVSCAAFAGSTVR